MKTFKDGENSAYTALISFLWEQGDLSSFDSPEEAIEWVLRDFLDSDRVAEVLKAFNKVEPPTEDGWYLVKVKTLDGTIQERKLYFLSACERSGNGRLTFDAEDVARTMESGVYKPDEVVVGWQKLTYRLL